MLAPPRVPVPDASLLPHGALHASRDFNCDQHCDQLWIKGECLALDDFHLHDLSPEVPFSQGHDGDDGLLLLGGGLLLLEAERRDDDVLVVTVVRRCDLLHDLERVFGTRSVSREGGN